MAITIDVDTGGTFTDGFFTMGPRAEQVKVDTTPHDLSVCFIECIREGARRFGMAVEDLLRQTDIIRFSTTVGTNSLLQKTGPKLGLVVTEGFADTLYSPSGGPAQGIRDILSPENIIGVKEAVDASGGAAQGLEQDAVRLGLETLLDRGMRSLVISFHNSRVNPVHEREAKAVVEEEYPPQNLGSVPLLLGSDISSHPSDYIRTCTALLNAYTHRDLVRYLYKAEDALRELGYRKPLLIAHCNGGAARVSKTIALYTYNSGPVSGLIGCTQLASQMYGLRDFVSIDVGGTSVDIGVVKDGSWEFSRESRVDSIPVGIPMINVATTSSAGGSIARLRPDSAIQVGPEGAGALPGPACYDLGGTRPTVTDADVVLGFINPDYFLGGMRKLHKKRAIEAIDRHIASRLKVSTEEASHRIIQAADSHVADSAAAEIAAKGLSPADLTLFAFGGAAGTRCASVASRLGIRRVIALSVSPVASAYGSSTLDVLHAYDRPLDALLCTADGTFPGQDYPRLNSLVASLEEAARRDMQGEGFQSHDISFGLKVVVRGANGPRWLSSPSLRLEGDGPARALRQAYAAESGAAGAGELRITAVSLEATCPIAHYSFPLQEKEGPDPQKALKGTREVFWGQGYQPTRVYAHELLRHGNQVQGPAILEAPATTYAIPAGWQYTVDRYGNGMLEVC